MNSISYRHELYRKLIHLSSLWIPISLYVFDKPHWQLLLYSCFAIVSLFEVFRRRPQHLIGKWIILLFSPILREAERTSATTLSGAFYMMLAALIVTTICPKEIAATALSILIISDTLAALIGRKYATHQWVTLGKSREGTFAFFISSLLIVLCFSLISPLSTHLFLFSGFVAAIIATAMELLASYLKIDDNLSIPLSFGLVQMLVLSLL